MEQRQDKIREQGIENPFKVLIERGEAGLREELEKLDLPGLRKVLLEWGLDGEMRARRWRDEARMREHIFSRLLAHYRHGMTFLR